MSRFDGVRHRLRVLWRGERYAEEQAREIAFHVELAAQAQMADQQPGTHNDSEPGVDAERAARRAMGNVTYYREEARRMTILHWTDRLRQDARYAVRGLRRAPGFTAMIVVTLALGFGVNAAMFSLLDTLFVRTPAGVAAPSQVRRLYVAPKECHGEGGCFAFGVFRYPHYRAIVQADSSVSLALFTAPDSTTVVADGARFPARRSEVSRAYFSVLGLRPALGRFLTPDEDSVQTPTFVAVISDQLWRSRFAADAHVIGRRVTIDRREFTIVGVTQRDFRGTELDATDLWVPVNTHQSSGTTPAGAWYESYDPALRLVAHVRSSGDEARLVGIATNVLRTVQFTGGRTPDSQANALSAPILAVRGFFRPPAELEVMTRVAAVAVVVLLIAVANVVNLLLLRATRRRREIALRCALGVSTARLIAQLIVESLLLSLLGALGAVAVAFWTGAALRRLVLPEVHWAYAPVDASTVLFIVALSVIVGVAAGLAPSFHAVRSNVIDSLKAGRGDGGYQRSRLRSALLVIQTALSVVLLVGAGLFLRSLNNVRSIDVGYDVSNVTSFSPVFPLGSGRHDAELLAGEPEAVRRLARLSGVEAVAIAQGGPMRGFLIAPASLPDRDSMPRGPGGLIPSVNIVSDRYFEAAGMHVVRGRGFTPADGPDAARVVIVNETMAHVVWPAESAIGKCIIVGKRTDPCAPVVGIVSDAHRLDVIEPNGMSYYLATTQPLPRWPAPPNLIVRARPGETARVIAAAEREISAAIPGIDGVRITRLADIVDQHLRPWRLGATIFVAFSILAFAVAGIGVYSVVAYGVAQRTHEMGVRLALGAQTKAIIDLVLADGLGAVVVGVILGIAASLALGRLVSSLLFGVTPTDPTSLILAAVALTALGGVASLVPALRAARVDPAVALRSE